MTRRTIIGIDPGWASTGIVVRSGDTLDGYGVLQRPRTQSRARWIERVVDEIRDAHRDVAGRAPLVAVEDVVAPTGHLGPLELDGLLGTAAVLGAVLAEWPDALVVSPGGHGRAPLGAYPRPLVGIRETTGTGGRLRHARSAWDIAGAAVLLDRVREAVR